MALVQTLLGLRSAPIASLPPGPISARAPSTRETLHAGRASRPFRHGWRCQRPVPALRIADRRLAALAGVGRTSVQNSLRATKEAGLILVKERRRTLRS